MIIACGGLRASQLIQSKHASSFFVLARFYSIWGRHVKPAVCHLPIRCSPSSSSLYSLFLDLLPAFHETSICNIQSWKFRENYLWDLSSSIYIISSSPWYGSLSMICLVLRQRWISLVHLPRGKSWCAPVESISRFFQGDSGAQPQGVPTFEALGVRKRTSGLCA